MAFYDSYPVSVGHELVIPKRHVSNYFDLSVHEQRAIWLLANRSKDIISKKYQPDGINVGINVNEAGRPNRFWKPVRSKYHAMLAM